MKINRLQKKERCDKKHIHALGVLTAVWCGKSHMSVISTVRTISLFLGLIIGPTLVAHSARAGSATGNLNVSASVIRSCNITTSPLAFGTYDSIVTNQSSDLEGSAAVTIACTKGTDATIGLGFGNSGPGSGTSRAMTDGTETLSYEIYKDAGRTQVWADAGANLLNTGAAPSVAPREFPVYGLIPAGQDVSPGIYSDVVIVTVNF